MTKILYPKGPQNVAEDLTMPSPEFKKGIRKMIFSLAAFTFIYLVMLTIGLLLAALLAVLGGGMIFYVHNIFMIILGAGLIAAGCMILYFMVKFIFERKKGDLSQYTEIHEQDHPQLFEFIRAVSQETGTQFPKHVYVSHNVNAAVFYDSTFLSMFFPVKKNLVIGLGLVNMVNLSEFKAVLAHEFGHFSQKSMKAGSYVYQANRVIYNMLYENDNYGKILNSWASIHSAFAMCAKLTVNVIQGIQWVQRQAYTIVNKQYSALSQQMEFHADAVAAMAAGSNNAIHALQRIDFADSCYSAVLEKYDFWLKENLQGNNLYTHQRMVAAQLASEFHLPLAGGLPVLENGSNIYNNNYKVSIDNQWASHPTLKQREEALNKLNVTGEVVNETAWALFENAAAMQQTMTDALYKKVKFAGAVKHATDEQFINDLNQSRSHYTFPPVYDFFYKDRKINRINLDALPEQKIQIDNLADFFKDKAVLNNKIKSARADIQLLDQIALHTRQLRSFNYDGKKYKSKDTGPVKTIREQELKALEAELLATDQLVYFFFLAKANETGESGTGALKNYYTYYFKILDLAEENLSFCDKTLKIIKPVYSEGDLMTTQTAYNLEQAAVNCRGLVNKTMTFLKGDGVPFSITVPHEISNPKGNDIKFGSDNASVTENLKKLALEVQDFGEWNWTIQYKCLRELLEKQLAYTGSTH